MGPFLPLFFCSLILVPVDERDFDKVVGPLLTEEYDVNYAFQTLLLKMLTDWPDCGKKLFDADLHHVSFSLLFSKYNFSDKNYVCQRSHGKTYEYRFPRSYCGNALYYFLM